MKWPFVSRKKDDAVRKRMAEVIADLEDRVYAGESRDAQEVRALREALFQRSRAEKLEQVLLKQAESSLTPKFMPAGSFAHNARTSETSSQPSDTGGANTTQGDTE